MAVVLWACFGVTAPASKDGLIDGFWLTEDRRSVVQIERCADGRCGRLVGLPADIAASNDRDPDPPRRSLPLCGLVALSGIKPAAPGTWLVSAVYDPEDGASYEGAILEPDDGRLQVTVGSAPLSVSEVWTRTAKPESACAGAKRSE